MCPQMGVKIFCIVGTILTQLALCDGASSNSEAKIWTCSCSIDQKESTTFIVANCSSSSCDCSPGRSSDNRWLCNCSSGGFPRIANEHNYRDCFMTCNCSSGILSNFEPPGKQIYDKTLVILLATCLVILFLAFGVSVVFHVGMNDKNPTIPTSHSSDRLTSCSSGTNSASHRVSSRPISAEQLDVSVKSFTGCIPMTSFLVRSSRGAIHEVLIHYSYVELENATDRFSDANLIGVGGSSHVYRGSLRDGRTVAIKKMKPQASSDAEHVFLTEIELLSRLHHCHIVPLLGYCSENKGRHAERMLVFEYVPNGNLRERLDGESGKFLDWRTRLVIALGAARGLEYLHEAAAPRILHRDVKSTNILLDEKWRAKITDLGMAKHVQTGANSTNITSSPARMQGTFGYFAPEYAIDGKASLKSDVFSFGVVLLELITGRKPIQKNSDETSQSLVIWATPRLHDSKRVILELPDPRLEGDFQEEEMQVMAYLAKECLLLDPGSRPSMSEVVQILSTIVPNKYKWNNLPLHCRQLHLPDENLCYGSNVEEIKNTTFEVKNKSRAATDPFPESDKVKLLSSVDDVVVDLTEPWFESFHLSDADSRLCRVARKGH